VSEADLGSPLQSGGRTLRMSKRQWRCYRNISTGRNFDRRSASISGPALPVLLPNRPLRNRVCTPLFLLLTGHGNPSQWTTCRASHPPSGEMTVFLWFVDHFSKMGILVACKKSITTEATAKLFFERVWVHFGIPQTIVSDWDSRFLNTFWSSLWSLLDTKLTKSTAFHPQTDGQTEVVNQ
jgi:hypothetical protein